MYIIRSLSRKKKWIWNCFKNIWNSNPSLTNLFLFLRKHHFNAKMLLVLSPKSSDLFLGDVKQCLKVVLHSFHFIKSVVKKEAKNEIFFSAAFVCPSQNIHVYYIYKEKKWLTLSSSWASYEAPTSVILWKI